MINKPTEQSKTNFPVKLSSPARRALDAAGYTQLEQLTAVSENEIKKLHGIGPNAIGQLRRALSEKGSAFAGENPVKEY